MNNNREALTLEMIGARIRNKRESLGMTQQELSDIGQHADGLGESLEQREVDEFEDSDTYYDDDGEIYEETLHWKVYISFWQDKNFRIMTEEELKG